MDILDRRIWERNWLDLWTVVHLTTGMCFGFAIFFYGSPYMESFVVFIIFAIIWEILEYYDRAKEPLSNQFTDVLSGVLGFWLTAKFIPILASGLGEQLFYFTLVYIIAWGFAYVGFQSFAKHLNRDAQKYKKSFSAAILLYFIILVPIFIF